VAVQEIPPVESAVTAVRVQIVKDFKGENESETIKKILLRLPGLTIFIIWIWHIYLDANLTKGWVLKDGEKLILLSPWVFCGVDCIQIRSPFRRFFKYREPRRIVISN